MGDGRWDLCAGKKWIHLELTKYGNCRSWYVDEWCMSTVAENSSTVQLVFCWKLTERLVLWQLLQFNVTYFSGD